MKKNSISFFVFVFFLVPVLSFASGVKKQWTYRPETGYVDASPAVADLDGDGVKDLIFATISGRVIALNSLGLRIWYHDTEERITTPPLVADLDKDGIKEVIVYSNSGKISCLNGINGNLNWEYSMPGEIIWGGTSLLAATIIGNEDLEIVASDTDGNLVCLKADGSVAWKKKFDEKFNTALAVAKLPEDKNLSILTGSDRSPLIFLSNKGKEKWRVKNSEPSGSGPLVFDIDDDGKPEIIVGSGNELNVFDYLGEKKWSFAMRGKLHDAISVGNITGDEKKEIIAVDLNGNVKAFTSNGKILWDAKVPLRARRSATIADIDGDGKVEVLVASYSSDLYVFDSEGKQKYVVPLKGAMNSSATIVDFRNNGDLTVVCGANSFISAFKFGGSKPGRPADVQFPEYRFNSCRTGSNTVETVAENDLTEAADAALKQMYSNYVPGFTKDVTALKSMIEEMRAALDPEKTAYGFESDRLIVYDYKLNELDKKIAKASTYGPLDLSVLKNSLKILRGEIETFHKLYGYSKQQKIDFTAFAANPWAPFGGVDELLEDRVSDPKVFVGAFRGETESAAVNIANFAGKTLTFRVEASKLVNREDSTEVKPWGVIEFHEVVDVPTQFMDYSADALPLLNNAQLLSVPNYDLRQLWLNVNTKNLTTGLWEGEVTLKSVELESQEIKIPVSIRVWKAALPQHDPLRLCQWGYVNTSRLKDFPEEAYIDQTEHGTNVFVGAGYIPKAAFDKNGDLTGEIDFKKHDEYVLKHIKKDGLVLFVGYQGGLKGDEAYMSDAWKKAHKQWIRRWISHLKELGISYDQYAFYPVDEPGLEGGRRVDRLISLGKLLREADPKAHIYTDPAGAVTLEHLKKMAPYVDIWCPHRHDFLLHESSDMLDFVKSTGKTVWTYECYGNAKHLSPLGYYRGQSWLSRYHDLTGIGFWSYCTSSADPWFVPQGTLDYLLIYQGKGVVASKRWEAVRDGKEDYAMLQKLQETVDKTKGKAPQGLIDEAEKLLTDDVAKVAAYCGLDDDGVEPGIGGLKEMRQIEDKRWKSIVEIRRHLAALLDELSRYVDEN